MKNILLILAVAFSSASFAQGNLQFNQVINYENSAPSGAGAITHGTITVPAGKVWKIETCTFSRLATGKMVQYTNLSNVFIDENCLYHFYGSNNPKTSFLPLWLSEGTYTVTSNGVSSTTATVAFSAIEFNVVP